MVALYTYRCAGKVVPAGSFNCGGSHVWEVDYTTPDEAGKLHLRARMVNCQRVDTYTGYKHSVLGLDFNPPSAQPHPYSERKVGLTKNALNTEDWPRPGRVGMIGLGQLGQAVPGRRCET